MEVRGRSPHENFGYWSTLKFRGYCEYSHIGRRVLRYSENVHKERLAGVLLSTLAFEKVRLGGVGGTLSTPRFSKSTGGGGTLKYSGF